MFGLESLKKICRDYQDRINKLEDEKFDIEYIVKRKDFEVSLSSVFQKQYQQIMIF